MNSSNMKRHNWLMIMMGWQKPEDKNLSDENYLRSSCYQRYHLIISHNKRQNMKNQKYLAKFENIKQEDNYYSHQAYELYKLKYYFDNGVDPFNTNYPQLHQLLSNTFQHARRRENFFTNIDRHPDYTLRCIYTGKILSDAQGNMLIKANQEHSFPQSYQKGSKAGTGRDMHAIFASDSSVNGGRGNIPFGNKGKLIEENESGKIYRLQGKRYFEPKINGGALARASLYILVCYQGCAHPSYLPKESLQWMINTAQEEVTLWQKHRNQQLYNLQGNRNPFIDYPELAKSIDFSLGWQQL